MSNVKAFEIGIVQCTLAIKGGAANLIPDGYKL